MPTALIITLRPQTPGKPPVGLGRAAHAIVLGWIAAANPALAEQLHNDDGPRPLTVAGPSDGPAREQAAETPAERPWYLRVTLLSAELEALARAWTPEALGMLNLDGALCRVTDIATTPEQHPWAGAATYEGLAAPALLRATGGPSRWTLEFASPVTFRRSGVNLPLPMPELVFGSLLDRWNALAPLALPDETRRFAQECLAVSRFQLRSAVEPTKNGALQIGALGRASYTAVNRDRYWTACVDVLARFAFFSGVGAGTARGLGRTRLIED